MYNMEILSLASDIILSLSVLYLGIRTIRGGVKANLHEVRLLDQSLKGLIDEASNASRALNDQLLRRQQNLEKLLFDISSAEGKAQRATEAAEDRRASLQTEISKVERLLNEASQIRPAARVAVEPVVMNEPIVVRQVVEAQPIQEQVIPKPAAARVNIYGDPIPDPTPAPVAKREREYVPLAARVEREESRPQVQDIQSIYNQAERMIRAGEDMASVVTKTKLSKRDIDMLSQLVLSEERAKSSTAQEAQVLEDEARSALLAPDEAARAKSRDPRLGILGAQIKRQVQVL